MNIRKVAVIGAGVMGSGIAAHLTNAGVAVVLLDIVPKDATNRNVVAETAVEKMLKSNPAPFMQSQNAKLITTGNIDDHLNLVADCDWVIEVVIERLDIKQALYQKLHQLCRPDAVVSSNTSSIPLQQLVAGLPDSFAERFMITHFFNPPRYMRLLEIVTDPRTRPELAAAIKQCCDVALGKGVVICKDTPGFIANRIGIYWIQVAILEAIRMGLTVDEADAVIGRPVGIPKTGVFGLADLVGIDLMPHLMQSLSNSLPASDALFAHAAIPEVIKTMIATGYTGRKGKGGFYRINRDLGKRKESINLQTGDYAASAKPLLASLEASKQSGLKALVEHPDVGGQYAWRVLSLVLHYAASLVPEIADNIPAVDQAMRLGYNWQYGPFELMDRLGAGYLAERFAKEGMTVPPLLALAAEKQGFYQLQGTQLHYLTVAGDYAPLTRPEGVILLEDIKRTQKPIKRNSAASLWDIGDGVLCLEFTSKMNAIEPGILALVRYALEVVPQRYKALVIYNEGENFSVGANLGLVLFAANIAAWDQIETMVQSGQETYHALKYAPFPVVGAPSGMALGGGCEILLHCAAVQAHAETYMGLVEVGVGVIPGWGGCKEMLQRWSANPRAPKGPMPAVLKSFEIISMATVSKSAAEAKQHAYLRPTDGISMNRERLLADAKAKALSMVHDYKAPEPVALRLPGDTAKVAMQMAVNDFRAQGKATPHDVVVAGVLAEVLSGGATDMTETHDENALYALERAGFMRLLKQPNTLARIEHMLDTGKPLRN